MPIANYAEYVDEVTNPRQRLQDTKASLTTVAGRAYSLWRTAPDAGAVPNGAVAPTKDTLGAVPMANSAGVQRIAQVACSIQQSGTIIIADRLSHQGGLDGTVTSAQTTNLPTAALTRYTDGVGVMAALEIYTTVGTTAATAEVSYTNHLGTAGRISPPVVFGSTGHNVAGRFIILPLADGDRGVRSVQSVTLAATTDTAGNFGVTLFKPLVLLSIPNLGSQQFLFDSILNLCGNMPQVMNDACLFYIPISFTTSTGIWLSAIRVIEE